MNIVVLDSDPAFGCHAAPSGARGELDTSALERWESVQIHPRTEPAQVLERCQGADVVLTNKVVLGRAEIEKLPNLKLISVLATGVNVVDLDAARSSGVSVCNVPGYSTMSTAQHALSLLLELTNRVGLHSADVRDGGWESSKTFSYFHTPLSELSGRVMGVVGYGAIGKAVVTMAQAFGMQVMVHTRTERSVEGVLFVDKQTLLRQSDVISLHCPLTDETRAFIDDHALRQMKSEALLVNVARGPIVDEAAAARALVEGRIAGMAADVLTVEPAERDCPLLSAAVQKTGRCIITPHIAWATQAARERLLQVTVKNIEAFQKGTPQNVVT